MNCVFQPVADRAGRYWCIRKDCGNFIRSIPVPGFEVDPLTAIAECRSGVDPVEAREVVRRIEEQRLSCVHRGEKTRKIKTSCKKGSPYVDTYVCNLHKRCIVRGCLKNEPEKSLYKICYPGCPDRSPITKLEELPIYGSPATPRGVGERHVAQETPTQPASIATTQPLECVYLGEKRKKTTPDGRDTYNCFFYEVCTKTGPADPFASCEGCKEKLTTDHPELAEKFLDPLIITDRKKKQTHALRNLLGGRAAFLVGGGPSARDLPLEKLNQRGVFSLAVNNMAGFCRTNAFVCSDPPSKFHNGIWLDPWCMKFIPTPKLDDVRGTIREKIGDEFRDIERGGKKLRSNQCPNTWGFGRKSWFIPDETFFTDDSAAWGNHDAGVRRTGMEKTVCTMLLGLRILYYLGARTIYLVGVDFRMDPNRELLDNYAFQEKREAGAVQSNNAQYAVVNRWLVRMERMGIFKKFGLGIYNCYAQSGLRAFPYVPFDLALEDTLKDNPTEPLDLIDWYFKPEKKK